MDLLERYINFIKLYGKQEKPTAGYYERHHITPKHLGGLDDSTNLAYLTRKQHYYAHYLLFKIFKLKEDKKALELLGRILNGELARELNPMFDPKIAAKISGANHYMHRQEYRDYYSEMRKGQNNPMWGKRNTINSKPISTPFGEFLCISDAELMLNLNRSTIRRYLVKKKEGWNYSQVSVTN